MKELLKIQAELNAPKSQYNAFGKFSYRSCEDILASVKPLLQETGCTLTLTDEIIMQGARFYVKATAEIKNQQGETESTTAYAREPEEKKGMDESQITGTASSYARKYALNGLFAIDDVKDADNRSIGRENVVQRPKDWRDEIREAKTQQQLNQIKYRHPELRDSRDFLIALDERLTMIR